MLRSPRRFAEPAPAKLGAYRRMKWLATSLLAAMACTYLVSRTFEAKYPVLGFVRALAEAAMVGGIADWFAVTALFRHPLGLPLPHTAIIPRNKDRIGENLATFVETNFLAPEIIAGKLARIDFTIQFAHWLAVPERGRQIARWTLDFVPSLLAAIDDEDIRRFLHEHVAERVRNVDTPLVVGTIADTLLEGDRHQAVVTELLEQLAQLFEEHKPLIRQRVRESTAWIWKKLSIDEKVSDNLIAVVDETLQELSANPDHAWRRGFDDAIRNFVSQLRSSPDYLAKWEALKERLVEHPALSDYLANVWREIKAWIESDAAAPDSYIRARIEEAIAGIAEGLLDDQAMRDRLNAWLRETMLALIEGQRHAIARLISDTVHHWDAATITQKIELEVGRDLQFVRINGTVIGGFVGLVLHTLDVLLF
ncbi:DUF445 domain-containing protein [Trinickia dabaoshanensis]|uniref:DUF445 domain-containing protein n=1 Tax=Trinickia dabaoshanensis TaxID=564714 RepID=A0A2N7VJB2_9BURK|nr:DUF445 domain-containing protein [Trinickia dabaoshanensis]PMS17240.1 DUF445 domain-containing protein [Trinickia dabaoshanensis]